MPAISGKDLKFYKDKLHKDKDFHRREFLERIDPDRIDAYFEGNPDAIYKGGRAESYYNYLNDSSQNVGRIAMNSIFPATSTLVAQFYPQNPKFIGIPKREGDELRAKVAASAMNYYYDQMLAVKENQRAIISAWMYGIGYTKQGWRTVFKQNPGVQVNDTSQSIGQKIKQVFTGTPSMEEVGDREYIADEGPFLEFVNPRDVYLDSEQPYGKHRFIHQRIPKSVYEIRTSGLYTVTDDFFAKFQQGRDERHTIIDLYESWVWMPDGIYVLVTIDDWNKALRWDKTPYASEGFPYKILTLTQQVNRIYPVSHMKVAQQLQRLSDYILTLQKEHIEKHKDITVFDGDAFNDTDRARIKKNEIGLNVFTSKGRPPQASAHHIGGNTIPQEMFIVNDILRGNIKEILTVVGARQTGESELGTATQEKIADFGNQLRAAGMQSQIKDFLKDQGKKLLQDLKQFGTAPAIFKITNLNLMNPETNTPVTEEWIEFATDRNPELLKDIIPAELDIEIDVSNTQDRSLPVMRKQLMDFIQGVVIPLQPLLAIEGKKFNAFRFIKKMGENFETIDNCDEFFDDIQMGQGPVPLEGGNGPQDTAPAAEDIEQGATAPQQIPL